MSVSVAAASAEASGLPSAEAAGEAAGSVALLVLSDAGQAVKRRADMDRSAVSIRLTLIFGFLPGSILYFLISCVSVLIRKARRASARGSV